jgi:hypothetical protein
MLLDILYIQVERKLFIRGDTVTASHSRIETFGALLWATLGVDSLRPRRDRAQRSYEWILVYRRDRRRLELGRRRDERSFNLTAISNANAITCQTRVTAPTISATFLSRNSAMGDF